MFDRRLWGMVWARRGRWARVGVWVVVLTVATTAYGALAGPVLRALFGGEPLVWPSHLRPYLPALDLGALRRVLPWAIVAVAAVKGLAFHAQTVGVTAIGQSLLGELRRTVHARLLALPSDVAALCGAGDLLSRLTHDAEAVERLVTVGWVSVVRDGAQAVALVALCFALDWRLAALAFGVYPIAVVPIVAFGRRLRRAAGSTHEERAAVTSELHRQLAQLPLIQLSAAEGPARRSFAAASARLEAAIVRFAWLRGRSSPVMETLGALALAGTLLYAIGRIDRGELAPEAVLSFLAALLLLYQPVKGLARAQEVVQPGRAALDRLWSLVDRPERLPAGGTHPPPRTAPRIELRGLRVLRGAREALPPLDAELHPDRLNAVVGPNGSGKTTLAWALARLVEPAAGEIRVDGHPLADLDATAWRRQLGWVTQEALLGPGSLRDNVLFGLEHVEPARLASAAAQAGLDALIARLPEGWDTVLADGGAGLSGGERRRVAFARALVREPTVLLLDEPEAHLDLDALAALRELLPRVAMGRTVVLLTHDASLAALASTVVVLRPPADRLAA